MAYKLIDAAQARCSNVPSTSAQIPGAQRMGQPKPTWHE
jgi:hypothetical protein